MDVRAKRNIVWGLSSAVIGWIGTRLVTQKTQSPVPVARPTPDVVPVKCCAQKPASRDVFEAHSQEDEEFVVQWLADPQHDLEIEDENGYTLLQRASLFAQENLVAALLDAKANVDHAESGDLTALHLASNDGHEEIVTLLLKAGADPLRVNKDMEVRLGGIPVHVTGGMTALHFAAKNGNEEVVAELLHWAEEQKDPSAREKLVGARDCDGHTAAELALLHKHNKIAAQLDPSLSGKLMTADEIKQTLLQDALDQRKRTAIQDKANIVARMNAIATAYRPLHRDVYKFTPDFLDDDFVDAVNTGTRDSIRRILTEVVPGVFTFRMFKKSFCERIVAELEHYEAEAVRLGLPLDRPNTMNNYGLILDDLGFYPFINTLRERYILPLTSMLWANQGGGDLKSHHGFVVKYKVGEDLDLATHADASHITVNVCLGKEFKGGSLYFHGLKGAARSEPPPYETPHRQNCKYCELDYEHKLGVAVLHLGRHLHGANRITGGTRLNWIIWYRTRENPKKSSFLPYEDFVPYQS